MRNVMLCFGLGYSATTLARRLIQAGWLVRGTTRSPTKRSQLEESGFEGFLFSRNQPLAPEAFAGVSHILTSIAPDEFGDPVLDMHGPRLANLANLRWAGYLGTTAVYGDRRGAWVDETSDTSPSMARAQRRVDAEQAWTNSGLPVHIFRLAGIYGPGRNAFVNLRKGTARRIVKPGQVFSRIHVEDIATTLQASINAPNPRQIYNVCDDEPTPPQDVVAYAAKLINAEPPPEQDYQTANLSAMARTFYLDNRRVRNNRMKSELSVKLAFPNYRVGLAALNGDGD